MNGINGELVTSTMMLVFLVSMYFLPVLVAGARKHKSVGSIAIINVFLGWTVIGWVVALAMAFSGNVSEGNKD